MYDRPGARQGASHRNRIYVARNLSGRKCELETVVTAFTDHLAVVLRITLNVTTALDVVTAE